jgi:Flp pilus assembly protein TadB
MARGTSTAKTTAKRKTKPGARRRGRNTGSAAITLTVIAIVVLALTALPLCLLVIGGMLPTAVAVVVDHHQRRYLARTVGAMNLAGVMPGALRLWEAGVSFDSLQQVIDSPYNWLVMYGAAAIGWVLYFCVPPVVAMVIEEWGEEVTGRKRDG